MLSFDTFNDPVIEFRKPFTPTLGLSIAPYKTPHFEGTGALYLRESEDSKRVFLLTCAHVARPSLAQGNMGLTGKARSYPYEHIIALGSSGYTNALTSMMGAIGNMDYSIENWQTMLHQLGEPQEGESVVVTKRRKELLALMESAKEKIDETNTFHTKIVKQWTVPDQRIIGQIIHVEPISVDVAPHSFTKDWALIALYDEKFDWATFKGNKVYIGMFSILASIPPFWLTVLFPCRRQPLNAGLPPDYVLPA